MNNFLRDLATAHKDHEGYFPGSLAYVNNNPGNIRDSRDGHFIHYDTYARGFLALEWDLQAKIFGVAGSIIRFMKGTGKTYEQLVMQDYVSVYAPSADHNDPVNYCTILCRDLAAYNIRPSTPLCVLAKLIRGEIDVVVDPPSPPMSLEQRLESARNALKFNPPFERASALRRLIERLLTRIGA